MNVYTVGTGGNFATLGAFITALNNGSIPEGSVALLIGNSNNNVYDEQLPPVTKSCIITVADNINVTLTNSAAPNNSVIVFGEPVMNAAKSWSIDTTYPVDNNPLRNGSITIQARNYGAIFVYCSIAGNSLILKGGSEKRLRIVRNNNAITYGLINTYYGYLANFTFSGVYFEDTQTGSSTQGTSCISCSNVNFDARDVIYRAPNFCGLSRFIYSDGSIRGTVQRCILTCAQIYIGSSTYESSNNVVFKNILLNVPQSCSYSNTSFTYSIYTLMGCYYKNCTLINNQPPDARTMFGVRARPNLTLTHNTIITGYKVGVYSYSGISNNATDYCCVYGNNQDYGDGAGHQTVPPGPHDIQQDPRFVDTTTGEIATNSPCVDAGYTFSDVTDDIRGVSRPQGGGYDIGCWETRLIIPARLLSYRPLGQLAGRCVVDFSTSPKNRIGGDLDTYSQPPGTAFIPLGAGLTSANFNRAFAALANNIDTIRNLVSHFVPRLGVYGFTLDTAAAGIIVPRVVYVPTRKSDLDMYFTVLDFGLTDIARDLSGNAVVVTDIDIGRRSAYDNRGVLQLDSVYNTNIIDLNRYSVAITGDHTDKALPGAIAEITNYIGKYSVINGRYFVSYSKYDAEQNKTMVFLGSRLDDTEDLSSNISFGQLIEALGHGTADLLVYDEADTVQHGRITLYMPYNVVWYPTLVLSGSLPAGNYVLLFNECVYPSLATPIDVSLFKTFFAFYGYDDVTLASGETIVVLKARRTVIIKNITSDEWIGDVAPYTLSLRLAPPAGCSVRTEYICRNEDLALNLIGVYLALGHGNSYNLTLLSNNKVEGSLQIIVDLL